MYSTHVGNSVNGCNPKKILYDSGSGRSYLGKHINDFYKLPAIFKVFSLISIIVFSISRRIHNNFREIDLFF